MRVEVDGVRLALVLEHLLQVIAKQIAQAVELGLAVVLEAKLEGYIKRNEWRERAKRGERG